MNELSMAGRTDVGRHRTDNQDAFISVPIWSDARALLVVIDGVGGYAGGERAAAIARESIERYMGTPNGDPLSMLREAVVFANNQINDERQQTPGLAQMCCVLTAVVADARAGKLCFVHVGDTRLYRYRGNILEKLTADHSLVGIREDAQQLTEAEAMQHPRRNEIMREVGLVAHRVSDPDFMDSGETDFGPGDLLLLCSDGLTDMITRAQIVGVLNRPLALDAQVAGLIDLANQQGGRDNITVVLAKNNSPLPDGRPGLPAREIQENETRPQSVSAAPAETVVTAVSPPRRTKTIGILAGVLLAGLVASGWYLVNSGDDGPPAADMAVIPDSTARVATTAGQNRLDSLIRLAYRSADHRLVLPADTLRLAHPLVLTDSLSHLTGTGRLTVLLPADTAQAQVAVRVSSKNAVVIENLVISGFRTGIETAPPARLQLKNVYFRDVGLPVRADVRQDTFRNTVMTIMVQDQPLSPKPPN